MFRRKKKCSFEQVLGMCLALLGGKEEQTAADLAALSRSSSRSPEELQQELTILRLFWIRVGIMQAFPKDKYRPLIDALQNDTDPSVRHYAAWALGEITGKPLLKTFDFTDAERDAAIRTWQGDDAR